ncbi:DUF551 domain-containing protein [Escherichia coli]|nr:DUF551 domain-containing protein [Escherichia coli]EGD4804456.1 DUF551 domain-containing protein [Escherichia coli]EGD4995007.1 DUF551 domain-containing protein [Escherichia coli]EIO3926799.1 DUF551 domain-containing protein [Escherichia coli]
MTTITKERLLTIKQWRETYGPGSNVVLPAEEAEELARIALASLEAEPVAFIGKRMLEDLIYSAISRGRIWSDVTDKISGESRIPLYTAPPALKVPDALPEEENYHGNDIDYMPPSDVYQLGKTRGWNACRAAMLHGAEPVSQAYKLPPMSSNEVNDATWKLHNMLTEHGPLNGRQFNNLKGCFYEAFKVAMRNYPVTPDGWISCSEQMPEDGQHVIILCDGAFVLYAQYRDGEFFDVVRNGEEFFETQSRNVTHWMPLPEPPQEVNRG